MAFLVVAAVEEGTKFFFLYRCTWRDPNFNYRFDAILYAVFVSLGFAAFENVKYVFSYGLSVALPRAILAVPGHMGFAVFMGVFYGRAKRCHDWGNGFGCKVNLILSYLFPVFLHGVYDTCCMLGTNRSTLVFVAFVLAMYLIVFRLIRRESRTDGRKPRSRSEQVIRFRHYNLQKRCAFSRRPYRGRHCKMRIQGEGMEGDG